MSTSTFYLLAYIWIGIGLLVFPIVLFIKAPYGRHTTKKWGSLINNRVGWIIMESPALLVFSGLFLFGSAKHTFVTWVFFALWVFHYINRTLIFPFRLRTTGKQMPIAIVCMALCFNFANGYFNGYYLGSMATKYTISWLSDPRFIIGIIMFVGGAVINWQADNILIHLRKPGETGYVIPRQGLFNYISCPNHLGEIIQWFGFAIMTWSIPGLGFAIWTLVNLMPRALHHHKWYRTTFPDYPSKRKAFIPFIL